MKPNKAAANRKPDGTFGAGNNANPAGRPKGQSLKEFWRARFAEMSDDERIEFTKKVGNDVIWRMAEGNPQNDVTSGGESINFNIVNYEDDNDSAPV